MIRRLTVPRPAPPLRGHLPLGDDRITVTSGWLERDGVPFIPVGGEIHFTRVPPGQWAASLARMRDGGITVVTTYAIWNHHEQPDGSLNFTGQYDLRAFVAAARAAELEVVVRLGPYAHGEVRRGGMPDRLVESGVRLRTDDPDYLLEVERWFSALAAQLDGLELFGLQIENELYDDAAHLMTLKRMAQRLGLRAPVWTGTAWGGAHLPPDELLPLFAGYSDAFWISADTIHDPASASNFVYSDDRDEVGVGADTRDSALTPSNLDLSRYPYATCELGGGMVGAYHRRPWASPADVAALALTKLGSGSVWQGYYMYHDGRNPRRGLQESHATGARNDFPELDYDFGAPLAVDGALRESWFRLRNQHGLIRDFGALLAPLPAVFPARGEDLRFAVRSGGEVGFLFVTNHEPGRASGRFDDVEFEIVSDRGVVTFPPVSIPPGAAFVWPFRLPVGDATLVSATAQPIGLATWEGLPLLVLAATAGIPVALDWEDEAVTLEPPAGGPSAAWGEVRRAGTALARWVVLPEAEARVAAVEGGRLRCDAVPGRGPSRELTDHGWEVEPALDPQRETVPARITRAAGSPPERRIGPLGRASAPTDFSAAARYALDLPELHGRSLVIEWDGDVARLLDGDRLVADSFFTGREWRIGAHDLAAARRLHLEIVPLPDDAPVHFGMRAPVGVALRSAHLELP